METIKKKKNRACGKKNLRLADCIVKPLFHGDVSFLYH